MNPAELARYADAVLFGSLSFSAGDELVIEANHGTREFAVALAEAAYRAGARAVEVVYADARIARAKLELGGDAALGAVTATQIARSKAYANENVARIWILGSFENAVAAKIPAAKSAEDIRQTLAAMPWIETNRATERVRGTICSWPTEEWAAQVYPTVSVATAQRKLAQDILSFCRLGKSDPPGHDGWTTHLAALWDRATHLTDLSLREVHIRDRGTDLRVSLPDTARWRGGGDVNAHGRRIAMNIPTEECFVSPNADSTEGTFTCSIPLRFAGRLFEGLSGEFRGGRLVRLNAKRAADRDWFASYLASIPNAERLGEIALVDSTSRIGKKGVTYFETLLDENARAHIAFGNGFPKSRTVPLGRNRHGVNKSATHIDVMIGTDELEATGLTSSGERVALIRDGLWQV
ncbi:unannotated protein [freshwater metagenome]|uniref:Unannotated protein n=1 Tax=freshwater metagenome TaxID=449393 RepID=A0A6J6NPQ2_9ZZZZ